MQIKGTELTESQLEIIETRVDYRASQVRIWDRYIEGQNPTILDAEDKEDPDNRVPVPFARKIVKTIKGYMFKPGAITYSTEGIYEETLKEILDANNEELLTAEIATAALSSPQAYEIARVGETLEDIKLYKVPYSKGYPVYDDTLAQNVVAFVHFETLDDGEEETGIRTVYYSDRYLEYKNVNGEWVLQEERQHPFGQVPVSIYRVGDEDQAVFDPVTAMIDEHDKVISSAYANERERFANSLLIVLEKLVDGTESEKAATLKQLKENRILQDLGRSEIVSRVQDAVAFLTKPSRGPDTAEEADRLERLIYDMAMVINPTDDSFGSASGIALRYKLLPMEFLAADIEAYFSRGLQQRIELIGRALSELRGVTAEEVTIHWRRNLPTDLENLADTAGKLKGILSMPTVLQVFPGDVVPDIPAELDRIEVENDVYGDVFGDGGDVSGLDIQDDIETPDRKVQDAAINGAQIQAIQKMAESVASGLLPEQTAIELIMVSFPSIGEERARSIITPMKGFQVAGDDS